MSNASAATRPNREAFLQRLEAQNKNNNINNNDNNSNNINQQQDEDDTLLRADPAKLEAAKSSMKAYLRKHGVDDLDPASLDYLLRMDPFNNHPIPFAETKASNNNDTHLSISHCYMDAANHETNEDDANHLHLALLDLLERQTKALMTLQVEVETLRKLQQQNATALANSNSNSNDSNANANANQGANENEHDENHNNNPQERQVNATLWDRIKNLIRSEIRQFGRVVQQIRDHPNLDLGLFIKLVMMVAVFGGRAIAKSQARGRDVHEAYQRVTFLAIVACCAYLYKTGLYLQIYAWIKERLQNRGAVPVNAFMWNNDNNNHLNDEGGNANERRGQRQRASDAQQEAEHHPNPARPRRFWSHGVIEPDGAGGFGMDVVYFFVGYVCSLLPTWKPETAAADANVGTEVNGVVMEANALVAADGLNANNTPAGDGGPGNNDLPRDERLQQQEEHNETMAQEQQREEERVMDHNDPMPRDDGNDVAPNVD
mmetsp:Transcript_20039/g.30727  ORF Transcript_20039/g.30727 Transcript_20039/m.30727 type:complete len:489 (-) Transcript_20039:63-1529(-)